MAKGVLTSTSLLYGPLDLSPYTRSLRMPTEKEAKECTAFDSDGWRQYLGGLKKGDWSIEGFYSPDDVDPQIFEPPSVLPITWSYNRPMVAGDVAYSLLGVRTTYEPSFQVGEVAAISAAAAATEPLVRGRVLEIVTATATGSSAGQNLGATSATQSVYAILHVISASGTSPTLDLIVESDDNGSFTTPTTRFTFSQITGITAGATWAQRMDIAGPITDVHWRVSRTIGGTDAPTFQYRLILAIQ
jgi:hypothetical protein